MFWIGVGAYVTEVSKTIPKAPVSTAGCNWNLTTTAAVPTLLANITGMFNTTTREMFSTTSDMVNATTPAPTPAPEHEYVKLFPLK